MGWGATHAVGGVPAAAEPQTGGSCALRMCMRHTCRFTCTPQPRQTCTLADGSCSGLSFSVADGSCKLGLATARIPDAAAGCRCVLCLSLATHPACVRPGVRLLAPLLTPPTHARTPSPPPPAGPRPRPRPRKHVHACAQAPILRGRLAHLVLAPRPPLQLRHQFRLRAHGRRRRLTGSTARTCTRTGAGHLAGRPSGDKGGGGCCIIRQPAAAAAARHARVPHACAAYVVLVPPRNPPPRPTGSGLATSASGRQARRSWPGRKSREATRPRPLPEVKHAQASREPRGGPWAGEFGAHQGIGLGRLVRNKGCEPAFSGCCCC